jgi:hypothetical protein
MMHCFFAIHNQKTKILNILLAGLLIAQPVFAANLSQQDKQGHLALGCSAALLSQGFALDADDATPSRDGALAGVSIGILYEGATHGKTSGEHIADATAAAMGALACIGISDGISFALKKNGASIFGVF